MTGSRPDSAGGREEFVQADLVRGKAGSPSAIASERMWRSEAGSSKDAGGSVEQTVVDHVA